MADMQTLRPARLRRPPPLPPVGAAGAWSAGIGAALAVALAGLVWGGALPAVAAAGGIVAYAGVVAAVLAGLARPEAPQGFAACQVVTLLRAALTAGLAGLVLAPGALPGLAWAALAVALVALALDGVDGWLARRRGEASAFGARFDMEVDAALILVLAVLAWLGDKAGAWVLLLGLMRYGFVAAAMGWPWLADPLPPSLRRKAVCVLQVAVLALLLAPPLQAPASAVLAALALAALAWSFAVDVLWLHRHRVWP